MMIKLLTIALGLIVVIFLLYKVVELDLRLNGLEREENLK